MQEADHVLGGQSMGVFCRHGCETRVCAAQRPACSSSKALPWDPGLSGEGRAAGDEQTVPEARCKPATQPGAVVGIPTPGRWHSPAETLNLVRKMYLEASPFGERKAEAVRS